MHSSGQFATDFTAEMECTDCGIIAEVTVRVDPEYVERYAFNCPDCGVENRPDIEETDPDAGRDCDD